MTGGRRGPSERAQPVARQRPSTSLTGRPRPEPSCSHTLTNARQVGHHRHRRLAAPIQPLPCDNASVRLHRFGLTTPALGVRS